MNLSSRFSIRACFAAALVLLSCSLSHGADVTWTGNTGAWETGANWDSGSVPTSDDFALIPSGTVNISSSSGTTPNIRGFRQTGGTLNISGGTVEAGQVGQISIFDGTVTQSGGIASVNVARIGAGANSDGSYTLTGGEFKVARGISNVSLHLGGLSSGTGSLTIAGGSFAVRQAVRLGGSASTGNGSFSIMGSESSITLGDNGVDGGWNQSAGSSLVLRFDGGGTAPVFISDNGGSGTSANFADGSILDVDHLEVGDDFGGTWTVMEVENGDVTDNGLAFAPGVDTNVWSFSVDNSGVNGKLLVTAIGDPTGLVLTVGNTQQQKMRYGMDYERLWYWTGGLNASERDLIAKWSAIDTRIDYIRVAINSGYELTEGNLDLSAYTNKIIPLMQEMKDANPDIKFFASPRPLNEAVSGVAWQPYPQWVTGSTGNNSNFNFDWENCAEYLERYILLMKSYGFKISFIDMSNEWQSTGTFGSLITTGDVRDIVGYLKTNLDPADMPLIVAPSAWNYVQGSSWINNLDVSQARKDAVDIAACHNTDRSGTAQQFADKVHEILGSNTEIWNTEVHGWKSTSGENETTSFYYMLEKIRAGFSGLNGWLALGTTNQGHTYILNPNGTPTRNVKYFIFKKLSETSNYGHALDIVAEPAQLSHTAALIKGNLMTVWVINQGTSNVPLIITPGGRTISESTVKRTRWTDPSAVEGFVTHEPVTSSASMWTSIPGESVCCFEILLEAEEFPYTVVQAEDEDERNGMSEEQSGDDDGTLNLGNINNGTWARYNNLTLVENSAMRFRVARPAGRPDGWVDVYLGSPGATTASILAGTPVGKVAVPETGNWQVYETIEACIESAAGDYDVVLDFVEVGSTNGSALFNLNWLSIVSPTPPVLLGDCNQDEVVNFLDITPFIGFLTTATYLEEADCNQDGGMNFLDIAPFIAILSGN